MAPAAELDGWRAACRAGHIAGMGRDVGSAAKAAWPGQSAGPRWRLEKGRALAEDFGEETRAQAEAREHGICRRRGQTAEAEEGDAGRGEGTACSGRGCGGGNSA